MLVKTIVVGDIQTNCYIISTVDNNCIVIDPGFEEEKIYKYITENGLFLKYIVLTHGHYDHISAASFLIKKTGALLAVSEKDSDKINDPSKSLSAFFRVFKTDSIIPDIILSEGSEILLDEIKLKVMLTPGHTSGSICILCDNILFSGDTLFNLSVGRTDFPDGSTKLILESLKRLKELNKNYRILSGHGSETTLDFEKKNNQYLRN